jgi:Zn-dependent protease with chaperone function
VFFLIAFFTKEIIIWIVTFLLAGVLMFSSFGVEYYIYNWNVSINAYSPQMITFSYPYLMGFNTLFFGLSIVLMFVDIFDKYGTKVREKEDE